jgi:CheY-like chemotaxis protein
VLRVLLVDDSEQYRLTFAALLEDAGHLVTEASSLEEAGTRLAGGSFDLVVLDRHLGDEIGTALIPHIRRLSPGAAIALVSGSDAPPPSAEVDLVVVKGADPERVIESLVRLASEASAR